MGVYTKTGDKGTTSLVGGTRVSKCDARLEAYGTIDEAQANVALLRDWLVEKGVLVEQQQLMLEVLGAMMKASAIVAAEPDVKKVLPQITAEDVALLEREIDAISASLPPLKSFILPAGCEQAARANVCRTICRRAERQMTTLAKEHNIPAHAMVYVNRLSDYLFTLQRQLLGGKEKLWQKPCK